MHAELFPFPGSAWCAFNPVALMLLEVQYISSGHAQHGFLDGLTESGICDSDSFSGTRWEEEIQKKQI